MTKCNYYPWEVKIKCNLSNKNVVLKLALAPLKFDLMKKSEIRENLKDFHPWLLFSHLQTQLERGRENNFRLGFVSKPAKTTPRAGGAGMFNSGGGGGAGLGGVAGGATADDGGLVSVQPADGVRRTGTRGGGPKTPVAYTGYSRRYQGVTSRYAMSSGSKKRAALQAGQREVPARGVGAARFKETSGQ